MRRTTITAPDALLNRLRAIADQRQVSLGTVIREALEEKAASYVEQPAANGEPSTAPRRLPRSLGMGASGHSDTSRRIGEERPEPRSWR
jgi:hypothetical protein